MEFADWLKAQPRTFPERIGDSADNTPFQNPIIGETQECTLQNVRNMLSYFIQIALPSYKGKESVAAERSTWGYIRLLECIAGAITFELECRPKGGNPLDGGENEREGKEESKIE